VAVASQPPALSGATASTASPQLRRPRPRDGSRPAAQAAGVLHETRGRRWWPTAPRSPIRPALPNFHHEIELVVAIGRAAATSPGRVHWSTCFGYAAGNDLTRRDLQHAAKQRGQPWDAGQGLLTVRRGCRDPPGCAGRSVAGAHLAQCQRRVAPGVGRESDVVGRAAHHRGAVDAVRAQSRRSHFHRHAPPVSVP